MRILLVQTPSVEGFSQEKVYPIGIAGRAPGDDLPGNKSAQIKDYLERFFPRRPSGRQ